MTDDDLRDLLTDAVADVEPEYRLDAIRARTSRPPRRRGWYAVGGAVLAAAAVVTAVSVVNDDRPRRETPASDPDHAVALYFVGDTPDGDRLYREFQRLRGDDPLAALEAITTANGPDDPDYRTVWPAGIFESVEIDEDVIWVWLSEGGALSGLSQAQVRLAEQQVVYTVHAATGLTLPVRLEVSLPSGPRPGMRSPPTERAPQNEVLALVSISDPADGLRVEGSFVARGRANSYEATVPWEIRDEDGGKVKDGYVTAEGSIDRLYKWETEPIDVSDLAPGRYIFIAYRDAEQIDRAGPYYDTRWITVE